MDCHSFTVVAVAQFDTLSVSERKTLLEAWVSAAKPLGLYIIAHVGTTVQSDAIDLATHAASVGANAIASVPPYYGHAATVQTLASWFVPIVQASGGLPFFYYHIPASTGVDFAMVDLFPALLAAVPSFAGVKYVSADTDDFFRLTRTYGNSGLSLMWAPEPKLQGVGLGAVATVLAESFFAPTWLRMCHAVAAGDWAAARDEQMWKESVADVFSSFPVCSTPSILPSHALLPCFIRTLPPFLSLSHSRSFSLSFSLTRLSHTPTLSFPLTLSHTHSLTLPLTHSYTHSRARASLFRRRAVCWRAPLSSRAPFSTLRWLVTRPRVVVCHTLQGQAERTVYMHSIGVDIGPPRPPLSAMPTEQFSDLVTQLTALGFFNQTVPGPCVL
jgi:N-acetylneuraminate lyase